MWSQRQTGAVLKLMRFHLQGRGEPPKTLEASDLCFERAPWLLCGDGKEGTPGMSSPSTAPPPQVEGRGKGGSSVRGGEEVNRQNLDVGVKGLQEKNQSQQLPFWLGLGDEGP